MGKNKLRKFAEMEGFCNVVQPEGSGIGAGPHELQGRWGAAFFGNANPIVLELGCGKGEYTVELARRYGDYNFIGVDIKGARMYTGAKQALEEGLKNVGFLRTRIEFIGRFFARDEVSAVWLTFPDPQMKMATKRLSSSYFLERYRGFVRDGGLVLLKTDSMFLYRYTRSVVELNGLEVVADMADIDSGVPEEWGELLRIRTAYEALWRSRGIGIHFLAFALRQDGELREPEREPERDDYRSNRHR